MKFPEIDSIAPSLNHSIPQSFNALNDPQSLHRLETISDPKQRAEAVAGQLETVFFGMMMKAMRATVPDGGLFGKGLGKSHYEQMLDQQFVEMAGMPRDPRFHETLVEQIMTNPGKTQQMLGKMGEEPGQTQADSAAQTLAHSVSQAAARRLEPIQKAEDQAS